MIKKILRRTLFKDGSFPMKMYNAYMKRFFLETKKYYGNHNPDKRIYVIRRNTDRVGLMSIVITTLSHIKYAVERGYEPVVDMQNYKNLYLPKKLLKKENSWEYFFLQPGNITLAEAYRSKNVILSYGDELAARPDDSVVCLSNVDGKMDEWRALFQKYIHINPEIKEKAEKEFRAGFAKNDRIVGVCCRGEGYRKTRPKNHPIQPDIFELINKTREFMQLYQCNRIYLSTEDNGIVEQFRSVFGEVLYVKDRDYIKYDASGVRISEKPSPRVAGEVYLIQLLMLAKCNCLVAGRCSGVVGANLLTEGFERAYYFDLGMYL